MLTENVLLRKTSTLKGNFTQILLQPGTDFSCSHKLGKTPVSTGETWLSFLKLFVDLILFSTTL